MWHLRGIAHPAAQFHALEMTAERAGSAMACPFASSAEYEASVIQARRAAGIYGPRRQRRMMLFAAAMLFIAVAAALIL
ncbi:MAG TPA: hypothetical protein VFA53_02270 [Xanthobacteraceae bacterium]|nr:hypothetical protein [Xanthobacteraceae bacterium]